MYYILPLKYLSNASLSGCIAFKKDKKAKFPDFHLRATLQSNWKRCFWNHSKDVSLNMENVHIYVQKHT